MSGGRKKLVEVRNLKMHFPIVGGLLRRQVGAVKAVDDVTFDIYEGETLGVVGESGCGKSTCGRAVLRLYDITAGSIKIDGTEIGKMSQTQLRKLRPTMQMVFQDPQACLNPRMTVAAIIAEPLEEHGKLSGKDRLNRVYELMDAVGLNRNFANRYPHAFSGGQRQRIGIARALYRDPSVLLFDEATSALDNATEHAVMEAIYRLSSEKTIILVAHRLSTVRACNRIYVLSEGKVVEEGSWEELARKGAHFKRLAMGQT